MITTWLEHKTRHLVPRSCALNDLPRLFPTLREGCAWITDESIRECFDAELFEDVSIPQTPDSHQASRCASLAVMAANGIHLAPITIVQKGRLRFILDGNHRLRAYQYLARMSARALSRLPDWTKQTIRFHFLVIPAGAKPWMSAPEQSSSRTDSASLLISR